MFQLILLIIFNYMLATKKDRNQKQNRRYLNNLDHRQAVIRETIKDIFNAKE